MHRPPMSAVTAATLPVVLLLSLLTTSSRAANLAIKLVDVAEQAGVTLLNVSGGLSKDYIVEVNGNGAAFFDFDNDDDMDLLLVNGSTLDMFRQGGSPMVALYENDGRGAFTDVKAGSGLDSTGWGMGTCVADYDNDGFQDLYVTAYGPNVLFRNNGDGTFGDVTATAGVGDMRWGSNCAFGDYDRDGHVDLYVANYVAFDDEQVPKRGEGSSCRYMGIAAACGPVGLPPEPDALYRNNGDGTFSDVTEAAGVHGPAYYGLGVVFADLNDDGWPDIYVANDSEPNLLYLNNGDGTFSEDGLVAGVALSATGREQAGMGVDAGDYDGNGRLDLIVTHFSEDYTTLYDNSDAGYFSDVSSVTGIGPPTLRYLGWGVGFVDVDNDGLLDVFVANGHVVPEVDQQGLATTYLQRSQLFQNQGNKRFRDVTDEVGGGLLIEKSTRGAAFGDYDNDGDIDVLLINLNDRPTLLRNDTPGDHHWITLKLAGSESNRDGIGAKVTIEAGGRTQIAEVRSGSSYLSHNDMRVHFGLGDADRVEGLEIRWPSGLVDTVDAPQTDRFYVVQEGQGLVQPIR
jgi:hypothetical protein